MKLTLKEAFLKCHPKYEIIIRYFETSLGYEPNWEDLTRLNLIDFVEYTSEKVAQSSMKTYCAMLKTVLNRYSEEVEIPCRNYAEILSIKSVNRTNTWLDEKELKMLLDYKPESETERNVRNQFIIGAYSGCRRSDFVRIDEDNIIDGYLTYVSQKTKIQAVVPVKPIILKIVGRGAKQVFSDVTFNKTIRNICQKCGINKKVKLFQSGEEVTGEKWEFVTSHTARRSFATNLYLRGADLYSISKMMGHSSVTMTERYISCGLREQSEKVLAYFK